MKKLFFCISCILIACFSLTAQETLTIENALTKANTAINAGMPARFRVGIISYDAPTIALADYAAETLTAKLVSTPTRQVVEKRNIDKLLDGQNLSNELITDTQASALGTQVGAGAMVVISIKKMALNYQLSCQLINVQTKRIITTVRYNLLEDDTFIALLNTADPVMANPAASPASTTAAAAPSSPAPAAAPSSSASAPAAPAPVKAGAFSKTLDDIKTEQNQVITFNEFRAWVDKNFPNIIIQNPEVKKNYDGTYDVTFSWKHTDKIDVVQTMAGFYTMLSQISKDPQYIEALKYAAKQDRTYSGVFNYYQAAYANDEQKISFFIFPKNMQNRLSFNGNRYLSWSLEFTLFDTMGNVIEVWKTALTRYLPYGKGTDSERKTFNLTDAAYNAMDGLKLTKITMRND